VLLGQDDGARRGEFSRVFPQLGRKPVLAFADTLSPILNVVVFFVAYSLSAIFCIRYCYLWLSR
jgi:hypothetical protein